MTRCGTRCEDCPGYGTACAGCDAIVGHVYWASDVGMDVCPIYRCCGDRGYAHCGHCSELPCSLYTDTRDPAVSDEAHLADVGERAGRLKEALM